MKNITKTFEAKKIKLELFLKDLYLKIYIKYYMYII